MKYFIARLGDNEYELNNLGLVAALLLGLLIVCGTAIIIAAMFS